MPYSSAEYKIVFQYPSSLYLKEISNAGTLGNPQLEVVMMENTQTNRDTLDSKLKEREAGSPEITVGVYQNPDGLSAGKWAENTPWFIGSEDLTPISVGGQDGGSFSWDEGLYKGKSLIVTKGKLVYVFTLNWLTPEDQLIKEFNVVLNSVVFAE